jgi:hypothetical protein
LGIVFKKDVVHILWYSKLYGGNPCRAGRAQKGKGHVLKKNYR